MSCNLQRIFSSVSIATPRLRSPLFLLFMLFALVGCSGDSDTGRYSENVADSKQKKFLLDNAVRDGVVTTPSGLQYEVLKGASGPVPTADSTVEVHYIGTLIDGTEFDSSYSRNETATFPLNRVIKGWTEGVQLMSVGSHFRFVIPAELAYGDRGTGKLIKGGDTLIFSIELIDIK